MSASFGFKLRLALHFAALLFIDHSVGGAESTFDDWFSVSGNIDSSFRTTQFFEKDHHVGTLGWDSRLEVWLPPHRDEVSYGPYLRFAGLVATRNPAWENALLAGPGVGVQFFPFSFKYFLDDETPTALKLLGPLRMFGEYNRLNYWGEENRWRPEEQYRFGTDYWLALNVNNVSRFWWAEVWLGGWWQQANEFDPEYNSWIGAESVRAGIRAEDKGLISWISPYMLVETSISENRSYYWENRVVLGAGVRVAPPFRFSESQWTLTRLVVLAEYLSAMTYIHSKPPGSLPNQDWRFGVSLSIGKWYRDFRKSRKPKE